MDIGAMNVHITFQKNAVVTDKIGNHKNVWTDEYSCFATLSDFMGKTNTEDAVAGLIVDTSDISLPSVTAKKAMAVTTTDYRILWNGNVYNIVKIDHLNMKKHAFAV